MGAGVIQVSASWRARGAVILGTVLTASLIHATELAAQITNAQLRRAWLGCYDLTATERDGGVGAFGTFILDTVPNPRLSGRLTARLLGVSQGLRVGWVPTSADTLSIAVWGIDAGTEMTLVRTGPDSLRGTGRGKGMMDTTFVMQIWARRRAPCWERLPPQVAALMPSGAGYVAPPGASVPTGKPDWIDADSLARTDPSGRRYTRNITIVTLANAQSASRTRTLQALGGTVVGTLAPQPGTASPRYIVWLEDGETFADMERIIARVSGRPEVASITPYYR
jgi:hypothetical protein